MKNTFSTSKSTTIKPSLSTNNNNNNTSKPKYVPLVMTNKETPKTPAIKVIKVKEVINNENTTNNNKTRDTDYNKDIVTKEKEIIINKSDNTINNNIKKNKNTAKKDIDILLDHYKNIRDYLLQLVSYDQALLNTSMIVGYLKEKINKEEYR